MQIHIKDLLINLGKLVLEFEYQCKLFEAIDGFICYLKKKIPQKIERETRKHHAERIPMFKFDITIINVTIVKF